MALSEGADNRARQSLKASFSGFFWLSGAFREGCTGSN
jgi:hypothetical protein